MYAPEFIDLIDALEAEGWNLTRNDWLWLASHADYHEGYTEWHLNNGDCRNEALTAAERNR